MREHQLKITPIRLVFRHFPLLLIGVGGPGPLWVMPSLSNKVWTVHKKAVDPNNKPLSFIVPPSAPA